MNPDEWQRAVQNEAEHLQDARWAADAAPFLQGLNWQSNRDALRYGLLFVLVYAVLDWGLTPVLLNLNPLSGWRLNPTSLLLSGAALGVAWLLGFRGYRSWQIGLTFALLPPAELVINHVLTIILPNIGMRLESGFGQELYPGFWRDQLTAWLLTVLIALLFFHLGQRHARRTAAR